MQKYIDQNQDPNKKLNDSETYVESLNRASTCYRKVLGLSWKIDSNEFIFDLGVIYNAAENVHVTRLNILRIAGMFLEPLELIQPITLPSKLLYQEIYRKKLIEMS